MDLDPLINALKSEDKAPSVSTYGSRIGRRGRLRSCGPNRLGRGVTLFLLHPIEHQQIGVRFTSGVSSFDDMRHSLPVLRHRPPRSRADATVNFVCDVNGVRIDYRERLRVGCSSPSGLEGFQRCLVVLAVFFAVILRNGLSEGRISLSVNTPNIRDDKSIMAL